MGHAGFQGKVCLTLQFTLLLQLTFTIHASPIFEYSNCRNHLFCAHSVQLFRTLPRTVLCVLCHIWHWAPNVIHPFSLLVKWYLTIKMFRTSYNHFYQKKSGRNSQVKRPPSFFFGNYFCINAVSFCLDFRLKFPNLVQALLIPLHCTQKVPCRKVMSGNPTKFAATDLSDFVSIALCHTQSKFKLWMQLVQKHLSVLELLLTLYSIIVFCQLICYYF